MLEKSTDAQNHLTKVQAPRLESLQAVSEQYNADPYTLSTKVRKRFREEKKIEKQKRDADDQIKGKYALPETLGLVPDDDDAKDEARQAWEQGRRELELRERSKRRRLAIDVTSIPAVAPSREQRKLAASSSKRSQPHNTVTSLRARILENTARQSDPFNPGSSKPSGRKGAGVIFR